MVKVVEVVVVVLRVMFRKVMVKVVVVEVVEEVVPRVRLGKVVVEVVVVKVVKEVVPRVMLRKVVVEVVEVSKVEVVVSQWKNPHIHIHMCIIILLFLLLLEKQPRCFKQAHHRDSGSVYTHAPVHKHLERRSGANDHPRLEDSGLRGNKRDAIGERHRHFQAELSAVYGLQSEPENEKPRAARKISRNGSSPPIAVADSCLPRCLCGEQPAGNRNPATTMWKSYSTCT